MLLSGPRQVGKTTLAKSLSYSRVEYLNFDLSEHRKIILKKKWSRKADLVIFDELHKMPKWKSWIKGIYDVEGVRPRLLITGSCRLDVFRRGGESLAGRHFLYRLHPISAAEAKTELAADETVRRLLNTGGFPEPFLKKDLEFARRWRRSHLDRILREDLLDLEQVRALKSLEILVDLLSDRVGSTISYRSLAEDLQVAPRTVQRWVELLERLFVVFVVRPYSKNLARAIQKEPKIYFYDNGRVVDEPGPRFENMVACSLFKRNQFLEDTSGERMELYYVRDREKREVDFLTVRNRKPEWLVETKVSDEAVSPSLVYFAERIDGAEPVQLVQTLDRSFRRGGVLCAEAADWLAKLEG